MTDSPAVRNGSDRAAGAQVALRAGRPEDAAPLSQCAARIFHESFAADNDPADMLAYMTIAFSPAQQERELADPANSYLIAESGGEMIGYVLIRPGDDAPECVTVRPSAEIARFYVDRPWHGTDVARRLMTAAVSDVERRGARGIWLGVWESNVRAVRFYAKHGFRDVGSHVFVLGSDVQRDKIMWRAIES
jgi:ribosomal protein S18 acetylase RimI-like enzyme